MTEQKKGGDEQYVVKPMGNGTKKAVIRIDKPGEPGELVNVLDVKKPEGKPKP